MPSDPPGGALLSWVVRASAARPVLTIVVCLALAVVGTLYTAKALTFQTSAVQLLPPDRLYVQRFQHALQEFGELNDIVVVVQAPTVPRAQDYADRLAADIGALPGAGRVTHRIDPDLFKGQALLYLPTERLAELRDKIVEHRAFIQGYAANPSLDQLVASVSEEIARRIAVGFIDLGIGGDAPEGFDPGFVQTLLDVIGGGLDGEPVASPWARVLTSAGDDRSGYFLSGDKTLLFIFVEPRRDAASFTDNEQFLTAIRSAIGALRAAYPDVAAGATGTPALSNDEMVTAFHDSTWAGAVAFGLTLAMLLAVFRRVVEPLVLLAVLQVSLAWSMGIITAVVGHLSIFSVMFISILIGIGIDYGIYEFFRYEEELGLRRSPREALHVMARRTGPGLLFGALTAAGTFGVLMLTDFRGIQEFGFIAGLSILAAFLAMFTLLPAVLILLRRRATRWVAASPAVVRAAHESAPGLERILAHSRPILLVSALLTAYALSAIPAVQFDYNRLNLQARGTESVVWERRITESAGSGFAALATAGSLAELRDRQRAFERLPVVSDVMSVLALIPGDQDAKIAIMRDVSSELSGVRYGQAAAVDPAKLRAALATLRDRLALGMREADPGPTADALRAAHDRATALIGRLDAGGADLRARLARLQAALGADFEEKLRRLQENLSPSPISMAELPDELKRKFVGRTGQFLMRVSPAIDTWDQAGAREFVSQLRTVDPAVTGPPVISYEASRLMEAAYFWGTLYAFALVVVLTAAVLRRVRETLLVLVPVVLGTLWTIGFMHLFGLSFNLANVWGLPLIIGASAEYGLNVAVRYREAAVNGGASLPRGHVVSVLLNGLTTVAGFGSLLVAHHQGIFGLGVLLTVGTAAALAASLILLPVLLRAWCPAASAGLEPVGAAQGVRE